MKELIKITEKEGQQLVDARELHEFLGNKRQFADWIKQRINQYGFIENEDFSISQICEKGGRPRTDYIITVDMAKQLSMVENNEKGNQARRYFIQCEKKLREVVQAPYNRLSPELKAIFQIDQKQQEIETKLNNLEENMPLFNIDCEELQSKVKKIATKVLGGYKSPAYLDKSIRSKVYSDIQGQLRREFGLKSYKAIRRKELGQALNIVENYRVPLYLENEIVCLNNQIGMDVM